MILNNSEKREVFFKEINILIIDNHPLIVEAYKIVFRTNEHLIINSEVAKSYGQALIALDKMKYHAVLIDFELTSFEKELNISNNRLAVLIKNKFPEIKVILTISENNPTVGHVIKSIPYDAVLIKKDITASLVLEALLTVLSGSFFYSIAAENIKMRNQYSDLALDELDLKILQNISLGIQTKNLVHFIPLSLSAIEKRKSKIKLMFDADNDELLLYKARQEGFI
ncbi:response regulator [Flavobacterium sharifuzzamanii]|uniref:response regulator transcription factor n=1 Tax=Flavobacterium sharifuzzamanii TaxID=2211133 RepID=UPI000DAE6C4C|nr:response regulator transcription factor [Flavobacterium sharifuzzamanii]KAF2080125.1 response regulator transcription factor [Flavobacterium sharifuzzamanii]